MKMTERLAVNVLFGFGVNGLPRPIVFFSLFLQKEPSQIFDDRYDDDRGPEWPEKCDDKAGAGSTMQFHQFVGWQFHNNHQKGGEVGRASCSSRQRGRLK